VGSTAFRELELAVDPRVLIPRPETEELVDVVLEKNRAGAVPDGPWVDVGTGSGAIALSIVLEEPGVEIIGVELSQDALEVARGNLAAMRVRAGLQFLRASLLEAFRPASLAAVISNPPYVSTRDWPELPREVREFEPPVALNGGVSGLRIAHELARQSACVLKPGGLLALELGEGHAPVLADVLGRRAWFTDLEIHRDLAGKQRFVLGTKR
jgi:release factor glutamine methyltransferase